jgi:uncharacterized protein (TIGR03083 family)
VVDVMPMIHAERAALAGDLASLTDPQWSAPTWCEKWNVQQLVGHLIAAGNITAGHFFPGLIGAGLSFDRFVDRDLRSYAEGTPEQVKSRFDSIITSNHKPPGPAYVALGEVMVHGEDIRRPLGLSADHPEAHLVALAEMYKKTGFPLRAKKRLAGLRLVATDVEWSTGDGPEVRGPCMSLILGMVGRHDALADCEGDGVATLRSR